MNEFQKSSTQLLQEFSVDAASGLSPQQVEQSEQQYGKNAFTRAKSPSFFKRVLESFKEPMLILLLVAAFITLAVNIVNYVTEGHADFVEVVGIFVAILLSVVITVVMEGRSAKAFEALSAITRDTKVKVIRDGKTQYILHDQVVTGDIVLIETGDKIPADGRLIESTALRADESSLTGESAPVAKDADAVLESEKTPVAERINMLYSGCFITGGSGKMVVTAVGDATEFGKIAQELSSTAKTSTPLQEKMARLGKFIAVLGAAVSLVVFLIQLITFLSSGTASFETISEAFITSIVLIVASVPEGLPTIIAIALALNIMKMSKENALVKKMVACETIGSVNVICSDKTGTLTENRMTVVELYQDGRVAQPEQLDSLPMLRNFCVNSTANVEFADQLKFIGNPTECALLVAAHKAGQDYRTIRQGAQIVHAYPFSSETKNMTTIADEGGGHVAYTKGSPEKIMAMCSISDAKRVEIEKLITSYQEKSGRVLAFAHRALPGGVDYETSREQVETGMEYDGFVVIQDPLRADVKDAVEHCRAAGIDIKMLTGDNIVTARAIAGDLGILDEEHVAVEAKELDHLDDEQLAAMLPKIRVIARSTPIIKMRVVNALKATGNVVAVTGDGINDAPAIKNADVGIAMGISGTEVSKEASDIVLLDDSFTTIEKAVKWGRGIYQNFQRFIQFQLTVNLSSVLVVLASILIGFKSPFTALQLLWINLIMDGPPALVLGLEPIRGDVMKNKPTARGSNIVTRGMITRILFNGIYIGAVLLLQTGLNFLGGTPEQASTIIFTLFVVFQLFNAFNSRELTDESVLKNFANNKMMLLVFGITFLLQILIVQFAGPVFSTVPLPLMMWVKIILTGLTIILVSELFKFIRRILKKG